MAPPGVFEFNEPAKPDPGENEVLVNCTLEWFQTLDSF